MDASLTINHLSKSYGALPVLDDWQLTIQAGERLVLLGPSGAGKTTFLRIIAGLETPTRGSIECHHHVTGFVFQEPRLIPWRNVKDNLLFVNQDGPYQEILKGLGLSDFEAYLPSQLSGGMRQRVNLARALICTPDLLMLDEAFYSLDWGVKIKIVQDLTRLWQTKRFTLIAVTHDPKEALLLADRIILLSARPARILRELPITLETPRHISAPSFLRAEAALIEALNNVEQSPGSSPRTHA
jgi:NitT/TauT family transport system ATP-binding protein